MAASDEFAQKLAAMTASNAGFFHGLPLSSDQIARLCAALHGDIATLVMWGCELGNEGARALASALQRCRALERLSLGNNQIGDTGAAPLMASLQRHCRALKTLNLGYNVIADSGAKAVALALPRLTNLADVELRQNHIGTTGALALAAAVPSCVHLKRVGLEGDAEISPDALAAISKALQGARQAPTVEAAPAPAAPNQRKASRNNSATPPQPPPSLTTAAAVASANQTSAPAKAFRNMAAKAVDATDKSAATPPKPAAAVSAAQSTSTTESRRGAKSAAVAPPPMKRPPMPAALPALGAGPALPAGKTHHIFLAHNVGPQFVHRTQVDALAKALQGLGFSVKLEREYLSEIVRSRIDVSVVFVACVTPTFMEWCGEQFTYAHETLGAANLLAVAIDRASVSTRMWLGPVRFVLGGALYDASSPDKVAGAAKELGARVTGLME